MNQADRVKRAIQCVDGYGLVRPVCGMPDL